MAMSGKTKGQLDGHDYEIKQSSDDSTCPGQVSKPLKRTEDLHIQNE